MMIKTMVVAVLLTGAPAKKAKPAPSKHAESVKAQVKDVALPVANQADGGVDVTKMPFTPDTIRQLVGAAQPQIQACYEEHLSDKGDKAIEGMLKTAFVITEDGFVKSAKVDARGSTLKDPGLHACVVSVLSALSFPKPPDGKPQPVEFPFNLKAVH